MVPPVADIGGHVTYVGDGALPTWVTTRSCLQTGDWEVGSKVVEHIYRRMYAAKL